MATRLAALEQTSCHGARLPGDVPAPARALGGGRGAGASDRSSVFKVAPRVAGSAGRVNRAAQTGESLRTVDVPETTGSRGHTSRRPNGEAAGQEVPQRARVAQASAG